MSAVCNDEDEDGGGADDCDGDADGGCELDPVLGVPFLTMGLLVERKLKSFEARGAFLHK